MSFPFPKNPTDGQVVSQTAPDGSILTATYRAVKNEWELTRQAAPSSAISSGAPPSPVVVSASADGQVITWDQVAGKWVAKAPLNKAAGTASIFVKAKQGDPDDAAPGKRPGDLSISFEELHHEIKSWNGATFKEIFSEDKIKQWVASGSLYQGLVGETGLAALPTPSLVNKGNYWVWNGANAYVVKATDPVIGGDLAGEIMYIGDWVQITLNKWGHISGDLMSRQRWEQLGGFLDWEDKSWEKGSIVFWKGATFKAQATIMPGDLGPDDPASKWKNITAIPIISLGDLQDVERDVTATAQEMASLAYDATVGKWFATRDVSFDSVQIGQDQAITEFVNVDLDKNTNLTGAVPSCYAVAEYIGQLKVSDLGNTKTLEQAADGDVPTWNPNTQQWEPQQPIHVVNELDDVLITSAPTTGQALIYGQNKKWTAGVPHSNMPEWRNSVEYQSGDTVHFEGRLWRAVSNTLIGINKNRKPEIQIGAGFAFWKDASGAPFGPLPLEQVVKGDPTVAPPTAPAVNVGAHVALVYRDDTDYALWTWKPDPATHAYGWRKLTDHFMAPWRHVALPPPIALNNFGQVWIYSMPGSSTPPIAPTVFWEPLAFGQFLVSMADVSAEFAKKDDILISDGAGKWEAKPSPSYTKAEADAKIETLVTGLAHAEAVVNIVNTPPPGPVTDEFYIVGTTPTAAFVGHANEIASWTGTTWRFNAPVAGEAHLNMNDGNTYSWNASKVAWIQVAAGVQWPAGGTDGDVLKRKGTSVEWGTPPVTGYTKVETDKKISDAAVKVRALTKQAYQTLATKDPQTIYLIIT